MAEASRRLQAPGLLVPSVSLLGTPVINWRGNLQPVPMQRARVVFHGRRINTYTPERSEVYRNDLQVLWNTFKPRIRPQLGPLAVRLIFGGRGVRGDLDNYIKAVLDAGNRFLWPDDRQIERIEAAFDRWGRGADRYVSIEVWRLSR